MTRVEQIEVATATYINGRLKNNVPPEEIEEIRLAYQAGAIYADEHPDLYTVARRAVATALKHLWHDAQGDDLPEDRQHCLIHYGGTKYCDFELAFFNAVDECFVTYSYPHPTGQSVISPGCDNDVLTDVYKNKRDKVSIKEIERWCVLEDILPK